MRNIRDKRLPALKELGASTASSLVRTSDRTTAAITQWPDQVTRDTAEAAIENGARQGSFRGSGAHDR